MSSFHKSPLFSAYCRFTPISSLLFHASKATMRLLSVALFAGSVLAIGQEKTVGFNDTGLALATGGSAVQIIGDAHDWPAVLRVCDDLAMDFGRVTGTNGTVTLLNGMRPTLNASEIYNITGRTSFSMGGSGGSSRKGGVILVGTVGNSSIIDKLVSDDKIDVSAIEGTWEAYVSTMVSDPMPGVSQAMVIAGSDRRGTVYGE